jgi:hypothetical protein
MKIIEKIKKWLLQWFWFLLTLCIAWIAYASITTVNTWDILTANNWNNLITLVNLNDSSISNNSWKLVNITSNWTNIWIWVATPTSKLDINSWDIKLWWYKAIVNIWSAFQTSNINVTDAIWTNIPWVTKTFNLLSPKTVKLRANWSVYPSWWTVNYTHCWFRFFIDWVWYWNNIWWDQITGCATSTALVGNWCPWNIEREIDLSSWTHSVNVQITGWWISYPWCVIDSNDYSKARLFIEAW